MKLGENMTRIGPVLLIALCSLLIAHCGDDEEPAGSSTTDAGADTVADAADMVADADVTDDPVEDASSDADVTDDADADADADAGATLEDTTEGDADATADAFDADADWTDADWTDADPDACTNDDHEPRADRPERLGRLEPAGSEFNVEASIDAETDPVDRFTFEIDAGCYAFIEGSFYGGMESEGTLDASIEGGPDGTLNVDDVEEFAWYVGAAEAETTQFLLTISDPFEVCASYGFSIEIGCDFDPDVCVQDDREATDDLSRADAAVVLGDGDEHSDSGLTGRLNTGDSTFDHESDRVVVQVDPECTLEGTVSGGDSLFASGDWYPVGEGESHRIDNLPIGEAWALRNSSGFERYFEIRIGSPWDVAICESWTAELGVTCPDDTTHTCDDELEPNDETPWNVYPRHDGVFFLEGSLDSVDDPIDRYRLHGELGCSAFIKLWGDEETLATVSNDTIGSVEIISESSEFERFEFGEIGFFDVVIEDDTNTCEDYQFYIDYSCAWTSEFCAQDDAETDDADGSTPNVVASLGTPFSGTGIVGSVMGDEDFEWDYSDWWYADVPADCALLGDVVLSGGVPGGNLGWTRVGYLRGDEEVAYLSERRTEETFIVHNRSEDERRYLVDVRASSSITQCMWYDLSLEVDCEEPDVPSTPVLSADDLRPGDLLVTEVLVTGAASCESSRDAPFFELLYTGDGSVDLAGLSIIIDEGFGQTINPDIILASGERAVFGTSHLTEACMGVAADYNIVWQLQAGWVVFISNRHDVIDAIDLNEGSPLVPWTSAVSWELDDVTFDQWCLAEDEVTSSTGVLATPGTPNGACPSE